MSPGPHRSPYGRHPGTPANPRFAGYLDGVLVVDKPAGPTSHDIVDRVRRTFRIEKVGHGGTLDPQATGVLVLLLGRATKLSGRFLTSDKTYEGTMRLGIETDSLDSAGKVLREADSSAVTREQLEEEMRKLTGDLMQIPPMVSAAKVDGIPLYKRARKGQEVVREPKLIHVYEFSLQSFTPPDAEFVVRCTKGTYVRKLCSDVGTGLGCGACLTRLRRTQSGALDLSRAVAFDKLLAMSADELPKLIIPMHLFAGTTTSAG